LESTFLITGKDLVARLARDAKVPQSSAIGSPASRRATNCSLSSITEHSFQGIHSLPKRGKSVTHVSGTICYRCVGSFIWSSPIGSISLHFAAKPLFWALGLPVSKSCRISVPALRLHGFKSRPDAKLLNNLRNPRFGATGCNADTSSRPEGPSPTRIARVSPPYFR
jgi:hypothetical protein